MTDLNDAFRAALATEAGAPVADMPAPPRRSAADPEAPHGRGDDGQPLAPYGMRGDGRPRIKPAGPGRGGKADRPRVTEVAASAAGQAAAADAAAAPQDYTADLDALATTVWMAASSMRGGRLGPVRVPDCRPFAYVFRSGQPNLVAAWNLAAHQNPAVRGYVRKLSGDGSWSWMVAVAVTGFQLGAGCVEMARADVVTRVAAARQNEAAMDKFLRAQMRAMGLDVPEPEPHDHADLEAELAGMTADA